MCLFSDVNYYGIEDVVYEDDVGEVNDCFEYYVLRFKYYFIDCVNYVLLICNWLNLWYWFEFMIEKGFVVWIMIKCELCLCYDLLFV